jgi:hypothetical protein
LIVFGGWNGHVDVNTGGIYDPETDSWTATSTSGAPSPRELGSAVSTGSTVIIWGGYSGMDLVKLGGIYTPPVLACPGTRGCVIAAPPLDDALVHRHP